MSYLAAFGAIIIAGVVAVVVIAITLCLYKTPKDDDDVLIIIAIILGCLYLGMTMLWLSGTPTPIVWD